MSDYDEHEKQAFRLRDIEMWCTREQINRAWLELFSSAEYRAHYALRFLAEHVQLTCDGSAASINLWSDFARRMADLGVAECRKAKQIADRITGEQNL